MTKMRVTVMAIMTKNRPMIGTMARKPKFIAVVIGTSLRRTFDWR